MDCNLPGSTVHGILWTRILEWVAISSPGDLPDPGIEPRSPELQADSLLTELRGVIKKVHFKLLNALILLFSHHHYPSSKLFASCKMSTVDPLINNFPLSPPPSPWAYLVA